MSTWLLLSFMFQSAFSLDSQTAEVQQWQVFLIEERSQQTRDALMRSVHFVPRFKRIFREAGVPEDLVWLAFIESSFRPAPTSPTQAQGMFQFKAVTARAFGLRVDDTVDERDQPHKAAKAAAQYLHYLHEKFGNWDLVLAAYNLGEGDLRRTMAAQNVTTWLEVKPFVREETRNYVGKIKAAALIGNAYLNSDERLQTDQQLTHVVRKGETLYSISRLYDVSVDQLRAFNQLVDNRIQIDQILIVSSIPN